jgi:hypothetical protein
MGGFLARVLFRGDEIAQTKSDPPISGSADKNASQRRLLFESNRADWRVRFLVTKVKRVTKLQAL